MKKLKAKYIKPLLGEVCNDTALLILKDLNKYPKPGTFSKDLEETLLQIAKRRRVLLQRMPVAIDGKAKALLESDKWVLAHAKESGLDPMDLPHHGFKLEILPVTLFMTSLPRAYDKEIFYSGLCNYYMHYISRDLCERRELNEIVGALIYDVEGATSLRTGIHLNVVDTEEKEDKFMKGLFGMYNFSAMRPESREKLLAGTPPAFKARVRELWKTFCV